MPLPPVHHQFPSVKTSEVSIARESVLSSSLEGKAWVMLCLTQHPEIEWLADDRVRKTEEGESAANAPYSMQLYGKNYVEFDRTLMTLQCMKWILQGSEEAYREFTSAQPIESRLSWNSFQELHAQGRGVLLSRWHGISAKEMEFTLATALVLADMGKGENPREKFKAFGIMAPDHDDFYGEALTHLCRYPLAAPSYAKLTPYSQDLLTRVANCAHYGHITHLEGGPQMFTELKRRNLAFEDPEALSFDLFVHLCDVAGALGHVNNQSSLVYTEPTHKAMQAMASAVRLLADPSKTEWDGYNAYLSVRAAWLGLNAADPFDRVLARIGAMLRLFTPEEGNLLRLALDQCSAEDRQRIVAQLDVPPEGRPGRTPTYMPAVLVNLANNPQLGSTKQERLIKAIALGLPFLARVLEAPWKSTIPLCFNAVAGIAKNAPEKLNNAFVIDDEGNVKIY